MRPILINTSSFTAAVTDAIAAAQTLLAAGELTLVAATNTLTPPRYVTVASAGDDSGITFTVVGTRPGGGAQSETIAGANAGTATTTKAFETVASITASGATAGDVEAGYTQSGYSDWIPLDLYVPNQVTTISAAVTGTVNYSVQYTNDDPFDRTIDQVAVAHPAAGGAFTGASTNQTHSTTTLMRAVRYVVNSGAGTLRLNIVQQSTQ